MNAKPKRRWFRYSLRTLLVVVTMVGLFCGFVVGPAFHQRRVVDGLKKAGTKVNYDHTEFNYGEEVEFKQTWFDRLVGDDVMHTVTGIFCRAEADLGTVLDPMTHATGNLLGSEADFGRLYTPAQEPKIDVDAVANLASQLSQIESIEFMLEVGNQWSKRQER